MIEQQKCDESTLSVTAGQISVKAHTRKAGAIRVKEHKRGIPGTKPDPKKDNKTESSDSSENLK